MMSKNKLKHLAELQTFQNVYQLRKDLKGKWKELVFRNSHTITLELACGKGEYTLALARRFPERNFIGIDIKGPRIWRGAKTALEEKILNAVFLRAQIDHLTDYFEDGEVDEIWITFPDPYMQKSKTRKRLTSSLFLDRYRQVLKPGGLLHLKTDDLQFYQFTIETIQQHRGSILFQSADLYAEELPDETLAVKTFYELQHLANQKTIKYLKFILP